MQLALVALPELDISARIAFEGKDVLGIDIKRGVLAGQAPPWLTDAIVGLLSGGNGPNYRLEGVTPFQKQVLEATLAIPYGEVRTYQQVAAACGRPQAMRAVGSVMAMNPLPLIIPCHRVVRADGTIGAYSGSGPEVKRRLLRREGTLEGDDRWRHTATLKNLI